MNDLATWQARFFAVLDARDLKQYARLLEEAQASGLDASWLAYFRAIFYTDQVPPRWDLAQAALRTILADKLPDDLRARVHLELGLAADYLGNYAGALEQNRLSLNLFAALADRRYQGKVLRNMGVAHLRAFEHKRVGPEALDEARTCFDRSLAIFQALGDEQLVANAELHLGIVAGFSGHWHEALVRYTARAEKCRRFGWQRSLALTLNNLGEAHGHLENWEAAAACYAESLTILNSLPTTDPYEEADVHANLARVRQVQGRSEDARQALDNAIRLIEIIRSPLGTEEARTGFFGTRVSMYDQRIAFELDRDHPDTALTFLERSKSRSFIEFLAHRQQEVVANRANHEQASFQEVNPLSAPDILQRLPPDTLLLEYYVAPGRACVFAVTTERIAAVSLDPALYSGVGSILEPDRQRVVGLAPDARGQLHEPWPLRQLYRLLIAPVVDHLCTRPRVCIIPHGSLHYVPFHALMASDERGTRYLIEEATAPSEIIYAPSATVLLDYCRNKPESRGQGGLVVSHGPDLRYANQEAAAVHARLGGVWRRGSSATAAAALRDGPNHPILHFSGHASFDPDDPLAAGLDLSRGRLEVRHILTRLQLHADLVVLSGCETGQSQVQRGDELTGLVRAFIYAGTPAVLVTLWPMDDISTCILMERFYDGLRVGARPAQALRRAQLDLMRMPMSDVAQWLQANGVKPRTAAREIDRLRTAVEKVSHASQDRDPLVFAHPYYWAPFILVGDRLPT